jgi:hypothetical protein
MTWQIEGTYFENCNCDMVCPCSTSGLTLPVDINRAQRPTTRQARTQPLRRVNLDRIRAYHGPVDPQGDLGRPVGARERVLAIALGVASAPSALMAARRPLWAGSNAELVRSRPPAETGVGREGKR